jgi:hypothetical protein
MKKLLSLMMVCLCAFGAMAGEVVFDATVDRGVLTNDDTEGPESITKDGVTISTTKGRWNVDQYRVFKGASFTVKSDQTITQVVIECTANGETKYGPGCFDVIDGYSYEGKIGTWSGSAKEITLTATSNQVRMTKVTVTIDGDVTPSISAPTFSPAGGTYYVAQNVEIKAVSGATIYYTTDGNDPTTSSTVYSEPINVASTTTIKAIATKDDLISPVASATYTIEQVNTVPNIAAYYELGAGSYAAIANPVTVYYTNGNGVWVKDATGYLYIFGRNAGNMNYKNGDVIPGGFGGYLKDYNGLLEMTYNGDQDLFGFTAPTDGEATTPAEVTTAYVVESNFGHYITIKNATVSADGRNFTITDATGTAAGYQAYTNVAIPSDNASYNITGIIAKYVKDGVTTIQVYPTAFEKIINIEDLPTVDNIAGLLATEEGTDVRFANPVTAVYQNGSNLYIMDESGYTLVFGQLDNTYNNGDVITGIAGSWKSYSYGAIQEMIPLVNTFGEGTPGTAVEPSVVPIEEMDASLVHNYLKIENCTMTMVDEKNYTLNDGTGDLLMYLKFNDITAPEDLTATYNVTGFLTLYAKNADTAPIMEIYPVAIEKVGGEENPPIAGDVNGDGICNSADVTALYQFILNNDDSKIVNGDQNADGNINSADVTAVYKLILGSK